MHQDTSVIAIEALNFGYLKNELILKDMNLHVPQAAIYGFLGANGAGKSTTIRSILGLLKPQSGNIRLFGKDIAKNRLEVLAQVGALIESPSIYLHLSGYDNLKIACKYLNLPLSRIGEVLDLVNLSNNAHKISRRYSTGMKQRLGLAIALLTDPKLLILDEPTSGLDPTGIIEFRNIIKGLNEAGKTIFLSSHLLSEIEKIATQVGIIKNGQMIFEGSIEELKKLKSGNTSVNVVTSNVQGAMALLDGNFQAVANDDQSFKVFLDDRELLPQMIRQLVSGGIDLYEVNSTEEDLEQMFINLTTSESAISEFSANEA